MAELQWLGVVIVLALLASHAQDTWEMALEQHAQQIWEEEAAKDQELHRIPMVQFNRIE